MRAAAFCFVVLAAATPALAADTVADQASRAYALFAGGLSQQGFLGAEYGDKLFAGIAGDWVRLNGPDPKMGVETYGSDTQKFCTTPAAVTLSSASPLSMTLTTNLKGANFSQVYTLVAGSTFGEHTDPDAYLTAIGLGPEKTSPNIQQQRALLLSVANGLVQIYRPSQDILVMTRDRGYPIVLARCPTPPPTPAPEDSASSSTPMDTPSSSSAAQ
ncbi:MAG TPA: hypothetical protein VFE64_04525 [Devosia sp.]|jgi:hypothetical protein|nr:hypothetical protein [Devosia sp.]